MAPGTRIYAVKVLAAPGAGLTSQVICGIDWVTGTRGDADQSNDIAVANMSLGGPGSDDKNCGKSSRDAKHQAICRSTAAGVSYVVAAGNEGADMADAPVTGGARRPITPAVFNEALTVTAVADTDGLPGDTGPALQQRRGRRGCELLQLRHR